MSTTLLLSALFCALSVGVFYTGHAGHAFAYHPISMTCGFLGFGVAAVYFQSRRKNLNLHALLQFLAVCAVMIGFNVIYESKESKGRPHFWSSGASWHALFGGVTASLFVLQFLGGAFYLHPFTTPEQRKPNAGTHRVFGRVLFLVAACVLMSGVYKEWNHYHPMFPPAFFFVSALLSVSVATPYLRSLLK